MATQMRLGPAQLSDLEIIRDLPPESFSDLIDRIESSDPPPLTSVELGSIFKDVFDGNEEIAEGLLRQTLSLTSLEWQRDLTPDDVLGGLLYGVRSSGHPWTEDEVNRWRAIEPELRRLLQHPSIWRVAKTLSLSYDFAHLLQEARIVSDIRPVFDREATRMEAAVVSFTLRMRYDSLNGNHGISIAMNQSDVESLLDECTRALRKAQLSAEVMNRRAEVRTVISGSDDNSGSDDDVPR